MDYLQREKEVLKWSDRDDTPNSEKPCDRNCDNCGEYYDYYLSVNNRLCDLCQADKDREDYRNGQ